jgi:hypothetical protein
MGDVVRMPRWRVDIIRKRAEHLGTVEAANAPSPRNFLVVRYASPSKLILAGLQIQKRVVAEALCRSGAREPCAPAGKQTVQGGVHAQRLGNSGTQDGTRCVDGSTN